MATFAPSAHPPIICEHEHALPLNDGTVVANAGATTTICGESFETDDDGLPTFEDCCDMNGGGGAGGPNGAGDTKV